MAEEIPTKMAVAEVENSQADAGNINAAKDMSKLAAVIKGFEFDSLNTTLMQIPYGAFIFIVVLLGVYINDRLPPINRCFVLAAFILSTLIGSFGLHFVPDDRCIGRLICYYLTGSLSASFVLSSPYRRPTLLATPRR